MDAVRWSKCKGRTTRANLEQLARLAMWRDARDRDFYRVVSTYLLWPTCLDGEWRWLEAADIEQSFEWFYPAHSEPHVLWYFARHMLEQWYTDNRVIPKAKWVNKRWFK